MKTWEDDGSGNAYTIDAQFRSYSSQAESLEDYAQFLQKDIYAGVHKSNTNFLQGCNQSSYRYLCYGHFIWDKT